MKDEFLEATMGVHTLLRYRQLVLAYCQEFTAMLQSSNGEGQERHTNAQLLLAYLTDCADDWIRKANDLAGNAREDE